MTPADLFRSHGCSIANFVATKGEVRMGSGSGFIVNGHLVTCAHVMQVPPGCNLQVRFEKPVAGQTPSWHYPAFGNSPEIKGHSGEHSYDYAIIKPPGGINLGPGLQLAEQAPEVGEPVCCFGYPFEDPNLTLHQGIISAVYPSGVATMLKLDMSINPSNSGGPLVRLSDGAVVGVVARKATGLTRAFEELMGSYDLNIAALEGAVGMLGLGAVDPVAALIAGQRQMKAVSVEIARSANVGIGYAILVDALRNEPVLSTGSPR